MIIDIMNMSFTMNNTHPLLIVNGANTTGKSLVRDLLISKKMDGVFIYHIQDYITHNVVVPDSTKILVFSGNFDDDDLENFKNFDIIEVCLVRDFRVSCLCNTDDFDYNKRVRHLNEKVDYIEGSLGRSNFHLIKYEDFISGLSLSYISNIFNGIKVVTKFNKYITKMDVERALKNKFRNDTGYFEELFSKIDTELVDYNKRFGYEEVLRVEDVIRR